MHRRLLSPWRLLSLLAALAVAGSPAGAAEIRFRAAARVTAPVVRLADVAEVLAADAATAERLGAVELGPAPTPGTRRFLSARDVQDALLLAGANLSEHRWTGSAQIEIVRDAPTAAAAPVAERPLGFAEERQTREALSRAVAEYLAGQPQAAGPVQVAPRLDVAQVRTLLGATTPLVIEGGQAPWLGRQALVVAFDSPAGPQRLAFEADVSPARLAVVTTRPLAKGAIIHPTDVAEVPVDTLPLEADLAVRLDDVVGQQTLRTFAAGQPLDRASIRRPLVVRRGEVVTVYARAAGLSVRTTARARDDGSAGDVVAVESLQTRDTYLARVTGPQTVEVLAAGVAAAEPAAPAAAALPGPRTAAVPASTEVR